MGHRASPYSLARRVAALWTIEVAALWLLARVLPGLSLEGWGAAVLGVAVIGFANALVRPILLFLTLPFTVLSFGFLTLGLNALILWLAALAVPGLHVSSFWGGFAAALGLSAVNTAATSLLAFDEEDSVYRNIVKRMARRSHPLAENPTPGLVFVEFDGLSAGVLERAIRAGYLPTLARWVERGTHRIVSWDCGVPSQTSSVQAGILFGNNFDIPGFRWYEKSTGEMVVSNDPADARRIEQRVSRGAGLLRENGISVFNMFTGDARRSVATISTLATSVHEVREASSTYFTFFVNPYNFTRALVFMAWELAVERWEAIRQSLRGVRPRVSRGGGFPFLRAMSTIFQRDFGTHALMSEMFAGVPIAYLTFVGYDVVAHHAGPERRDALRVLRHLDRRVAMLERTGQDAPRPYRFVVLSDHGQTPSVPFRQRHGHSLDQVVRRLVSESRTVHAAPEHVESWGHLNALLSEAIRHERLAGRAARGLLRRRTREGVVELGTSRQPAQGDVIVCASGNLGLIYLTHVSDRVTLEDIATQFPGLIEGLVAHDGIGFVMVRSAAHGPVAMGRDGVHYLREHIIEGTDPLAEYGPHAAAQLERLDGFPHSGDVVVNGRYHPADGFVESFEEMVGAHGGLGGAQTEAFLMAPRNWPLPSTTMHSPEEIHQVFVRWRDTIAAGREPSGRVDGAGSDAL